MRNLKGYAIWAMAALLFVYMIGCACQDDECGGKGELTWYLQHQRPTVTFVTPFNLETGVPTNWKILATFSEGMDNTTINEATFLVMGPGVIPVLGTVTYDDTSHIATFIPDTDLLPETTYTATITLGALNPDGMSLLVPFVWTFTTGVTPDTTAPWVVYVVPYNGQTGVPVNTSIFVNFSEVMDCVNYTVSPFTLKQGSTVIAVTGTCVGSNAVLIPNSPLLPSTTYTVTVTTAAMDLAGNHLASDYVWSFTTGATPDTTRPTIILVNPANLATNVPINTSVNATFSEHMNASTITTAYFKLTGPGTIPVIGLVTYNVLTNIATFKPTAPLAINTTYTATMKAGVLDLAGNAMLNNYVWTFKTPATVVLKPSPIALGAAANFVILAGGAISSVPTSHITGNIGVSPASGTFIGVTCPEINGTIYEVDAGLVAVCAVTDAAKLTAAWLALNTAYNVGMGLTVPAPITIAGDQGGKTLAPGIYKSTSSLLIQSGSLTLDAQGDANAVWIFQIATGLTTVGCGASVPCATGGNVFLTNGALPQNVFWIVGSSASLGGYTLFNGTILANTTITVVTGTEVRGRLLAGAVVTTGAVTLDSNIVTIPPYIP